MCCFQNDSRVELCEYFMREPDLMAIHSISWEKEQCLSGESPGGCMHLPTGSCEHLNYKKKIPQVQLFALMKISAEDLVRRSRMICVCGSNSLRWGSFAPRLGGTVVQMQCIFGLLKLPHCSIYEFVQWEVLFYSVGLCCPFWSLILSQNAKQCEIVLTFFSDVICCCSDLCFWRQVHTGFCITCVEASAFKCGCSRIVSHFTCGVTGVWNMPSNFQCVFFPFGFQCCVLTPLHAGDVWGRTSYSDRVHLLQCSRIHPLAFAGLLPFVRITSRQDGWKAVAHWPAIMG